MTDRCFNETEAEERQHLAQVIEKISTELTACSKAVQGRKAESREMMVDLDEQRDEMDHAEKANMRQSLNLMTRISEHGVDQHRRLSRLVANPYFGRLDVRTEQGGESEPVYIGIHSFYDAETETQLIHDWRAPISSMFYEYELGEAVYEAPSGRIGCDIERKRQYRIERQELQFMLETSLNIQDDILQEELSRASDEKMKNIVATIQRDQNAIIRNDDAHTLIIQGAAGSGKTSIALHRIAFLLYRHKDTLSSDDILIISPNRVFAHYISEVLPELGEEMIQETTMEEIASRLLGHQIKYQTFAEQIATLLESRDEKYAERVAFKATGDFLRKLDDYIEHLRSANVTPAPIEIGLYTVDADWIAARFHKHRRLPISEQLTRVLDEIVDYMQREYRKEVIGKERNRVRSELKRMLGRTTLKAIYKDFYTWIGEPGMFKPMKGGKYEHSDVFPLIYLKQVVDGLPPVGRIKHVVIDEMQDYTPVQYQVLGSLYPCKKTILGDHNQSVSPLSSSSAEGIREALDRAECFYMHKSYRSSFQITELAQTIHRNPNLVPLERHGEKPAVIGCDDADREVREIRRMIDAFRGNEHNSLGIICKTQAQADRLHEALGDDRDNVHLLDSRSTTFSNGVMIATAYLAKGLEFDEVIVPFCHAEEYRDVIDRHMLYVACTRAMHKLNLTHTGEPTSFLEPAMERSLVARQSAAS